MTAPDLRDRIKTALTTACLDHAHCDRMGPAVWDEVKAELDAKDAEIARLRQRVTELDMATDVLGKLLVEEEDRQHAASKRAEQAEELLRIAHDTSNTSEAERARAVQRAEAAEDENRKLAGINRDQQRAEIDLKQEVEQLRDENARLEREAIGYRAYHQQIGDL